MREVMGTVAVLDVRDDLPVEQIEAVCKSALDHLVEIEDVFSTYQPESEISRLGRGELGADDASPWVHEVLQLCETVRIGSGGAFDVHRAAVNSPAAEYQRRNDEVLEGAEPSVFSQPVEPSAMVAGWAIDRAVHVMRQGGLDDFTVNLGGDIYAAGYCEGAPWQVGIQHPSEAEMLVAVLQGSEFAVATSGAAVRGARIETVGSGEPLQSITVVGPDIVLANAYATAGYAMCEAGVEWVASQPEFEVFAVSAKGQVLHTEGMSRYLSMPVAASN